MAINNFIMHVLDNNGKTPNGILEFEIRFGIYNKISSNIKSDTFSKILGLCSSNKKFTFIKENIYAGEFKKRTVYADNNNLIQNLFSKISNSIVSIDDVREIMDKLMSKQPTDIHCIKKNKIKNPVAKHNYKITLAEEIIKPLLSGDSHQKEQSCRYKLRCSWIEMMWGFDLTIVLYTDLKNTPKIKSKIYYEAEIEYNHDIVVKHKYNHQQISDCANKIINSVVSIIDCDSTQFSSIDMELAHGIHNSVSTLERDDLKKLTGSKYAVVDKADGERKFVYVDLAGNVSHINPTEIIVEKQLILKNAKILCKGTLIDCELIADKSFYGFDLLFYKNMDCRNLNLVERLRLLNIVMSELSQLKTPFLYKIKTFYLDDIFNKATYIWKNRAKLFPYELDGLIFTPIRGTYLGNLPNLKWKDKHSIDVRIFYNKHTDFTEFYSNASAIMRKRHDFGEPEAINAYTDHNTGKIYYKNRINIHDKKYKDIGLVNKDGVLGMSGRLDLPNMVDIVEMEFLPDEKKWVYLRKRPDKEIPNSYLSIKSVLSAVSDNINIDVLSKLTYNPSPYELIGANHSTCFGNIGFSFMAEFNYSMCDYYTYSYKNIIDGLAGKNSSILVLGGDKCILNALIESTYSNITIVENNCLEVYGESVSEGYTGLLQHLKNNTSKKQINIIWGNCILSNGLLAYTKSGQATLDAGMRKGWDTVFINSFETALFNHKSRKFDVSMYDNYITNLKKCLNPKKSMANIAGIFLSGDRILSHLDKTRCILMRDSEQHPLFKLYLDQKTSLSIADIKKYRDLDIFKMSVPKMIEIQRIKNSFVSECQPLVFDKNILSVLNQKNIKMTTCKTLKNYYDDFKKISNTKLSDYDCIVSDITRYFTAYI
jgi:hypothetical protein